MNTVKTAAILITLLFATGPLTKVFADEELGYDAIVEDLEGSTRTSAGYAPDPFENVLIHANVGVVSSRLQVEHSEFGSASTFLTGAEAGFGIDLFSPYWQAEGTARSFNSERIGENGRVSLKEFDLRIMNTSHLNRHWRLRLGGGLAARYIQLSTPQEGQRKSTTPASILATALMVQVTKGLAVGADFSWRSALIAETTDRSALNMGLRLDAQF